MERMYLVLFIFIGLIVSCYYCANKYIGAGFEGHIESFRIKIPEKELSTQLDSIIKNNENIDWIDYNVYVKEFVEIKNFQDTVLYEDSKRRYATYKCISLSIENVKYVMRINTYSRENNLSDVMLVSANNYGEGFGLAQNIGFFEKKKYCNLFKEHIVNKIKEDKNR